MKKGAKKYDAAYHSFDPSIAEILGLPAAVVFRNIVFWVRHNETNGTHFHEGRYWTYNSYVAYEEQFPYLTAKQIRTALDKLLEAGLILKGNFARDRFKRANWYALVETDCPQGQIDEPEVAIDTIAPEGKTSATQGKCIENRYKPDSKPYPLSSSADKMVESDLDQFWVAYPEDRRRDWKSCQLLLRDALQQVSLADLIAAARTYAAESASTPRSKVSFIDNWLRQAKWQRHVDDRKRKLAAISAKVGGRTAGPAVVLQAISDDESKKIANWDQQLAKWNLPRFKDIALRGVEGKKEGWLWPRYWVPSSQSELSLIEEYARWLYETQTGRELFDQGAN